MNQNQNNGNERKEIIHIGICVDDCDPNRFRKANNGKMYLNAVAIPTPNSDFSEYMIKQNVSQEEREAGVEIIIGNGEENTARRARYDAKNGGGQQPAPQQPAQQRSPQWGSNAAPVAASAPRGNEDDVPF
jgi:hypothetical protein